MQGCESDQSTSSREIKWHSGSSLSPILIYPPFPPLPLILGNGLLKSGTTGHTVWPLPLWRESSALMGTPFAIPNRSPAHLASASRNCSPALHESVITEFHKLRVISAPFQFSVYALNDTQNCQDNTQFMLSCTHFGAFGSNNGKG